MKNIEVKLLRYFDGESIVGAVAKCYENPKADMKLAEKVVNVNHHDSITEHAVFQFDIDGMSRLCLQEFVRHRMASPTVKSTRYTLKPMLNEFDELLNVKGCWTETDLMELVEKYFVNPYNFPDEYRHIAEVTKLEKSWLYDKIDSIKRLIEQRKLFDELKEKILKFPNRPNDYLKYSLNEALRTKLRWTVNLRSIRNFLSLRHSEKAHFEIRHIAYLVKSLVENSEYGNFVKEIGEIPQ